jgi:alkylhydroperoxidase family enzyme
MELVHLRASQINGCSVCVYRDEKQLAGLVLWVATTNLFNRLNATTRQPAGAAW